MTREQKIALILGFALVLVVGVLVSDHLSGAREAELVDIEIPEPESEPITRTMPRRENTGMPAPTSEPARRLAHIAEPSPSKTEPEPDRDDQPRLAQAPERTETKTAMEVMRERVSDAMNQLRRGNGPRPAVQTDGITMGQPVARPGQDKPDDTLRTHIVRKGETLWKIAQTYYGTGFVHEDLLAYNRDRIRTTRDINPGLTLLIPPRHKLDEPPERPAAKPKARKKETPRSTRTYTVREGDTLSEISQSQLGTAKRWREILELNAERLDEPTDIFVGMTLKLPAR